jgi:hypothetical protein
MKITKKSLINIFKKKNYSSFELILKDHTDDFFKWFRLNSEKHRFDESPININLPDDYKPEFGKCFKNSQYYHFFLNYDYLEGFVSKIERSTIKHFINHAFNANNNELIDFTYYSDKSKLKEKSGFLPEFYVGVRVPNNIMDKIFHKLQIDKNETKGLSLSVSLLITYFIIDTDLGLNIKHYTEPIDY